MPAEGSSPAGGPSTDRRWELTAVTDEGTLDRILDLVGEMSAAEEVDEDARMQFEVAVAEIAANIIEHAGNGEQVTLSLELLLSPDRLEARFTDNGTPARVDLRSVEMPDALAERGRGLAIALSALDELAYRRRLGSNMWHLVCYRGGGGADNNSADNDSADNNSADNNDDDEVSDPDR
ncbi:ATP-binding protein [Dietzia kunjamensis]|uniref:ATP-binding protein n=1 Tax=Dietzia kunjamensis TaxID=322509 RepID=UPI0022B31988|nr:ATP-binding protein [Dietzia kunjamensis]MCZ4655181.1 ATP-binding protein [Dietzia kunjamensis]